MEAIELKIALNIVLFVVLLILSKKINKKGNYNLVIMVLCIFFCLFSFYGGDYFSYQYTFEQHKYEGANIPLEDIYITLIEILPTYVIFRLVIWGGGLILFYLSSRFLQLKTSRFLYLYVVFLLLTFSYARVSLGMSIVMFGYSLLISPRGNMAYKIIGVACILCSTMFHRTIILPAALSLLSLISLNRFRLGLMLLLLPVIIILINHYFNSMIFESGMLDESQLRKATSYLSDSHQKERGIGALINFTLQYAAVYYGLYVLVRTYFKRKIKISPWEKKLFTFCILMSAVGTSMYFVPNAFVFFYRIMSLTKFPILLVICALYPYIKRNQIRIFITLALLFDIYQLAYSFYLKII